MSLQLGSGYFPYILDALQAATLENTPMSKVRIPGFLNLLYDQDGKQTTTLNRTDGNQRWVQLSYKQRLTEGFIQDTAGSCDVTNLVTTAEAEVNMDITKSVSLYLDVETLRKYPPSQTSKVSLGPGTIYRELYDRILTATNAMFTSCNRALLAKQVSNFGVNVVSGSNAAVSVNLEKNTDYNALADGETKLLTDYHVNENMGKPMIVGSGLIHSYFLQQGAKSANQAGIDTKFFANSFDFYYDQTAAAEWGANQFGIFSPNSVQLVEFFTTTGVGADKLGNSIFFRMQMPTMRGNEIRPVMFDAQLKEIDCATTFTDGYYGTTITVDRGWQLIISKQMGLFNVPSQAYRATDYLLGNNGTYRYTATNNCTTCG